MPQEKTSELYKQAIEEYEQISADPETDEATRKEANNQIAQLRKKVQEAAFDAISSRTAKLNELSDSLKQVSKKAQSAGLAGHVSNIKQLADKITTVTNSLKG